ncbi:hypothetical protein RvY_13145 [Ramazzottius varieornatus]|uniref:Transcription initiation factor TFIID subunit 2 n=1 Tax=Ramazzottius varieornatus TaxID=947166 RepID=A0A1D1VQY4_RAMVA|nr:hypothetical protein RvY_13145 [Ramazzottius varieornatus]
MDRDRSPEKSPKKGAVLKSRPFRLLHQLISITHIDFNAKRIVAYTELQIKLLSPDTRNIRLNCKQCKIFGVTIDDEIDAEFSLVDPTLDICQGEKKKKNLDFFSNQNATLSKLTSADRGEGELTITLPTRPRSPSLTSLHNSVTTRSHSGDIVKLGVEFVVENPQAGLYFVLPASEDDKKKGPSAKKSLAERGCYLFSGGPENSSRLWFPCVDSYAESCPWNIEITVDKDLTAVSCGQLLSTALTPDDTHKVFSYELTIPTCASHIAIAVGPFEVFTDPNMNEMVHYCLPRLLPSMKHATSYVHQVFEFCEEYLSDRYPYSIYRQVFVDQTFVDLASYATLSIINCKYLSPKHIIDTHILSRSIMARGVCQQFFTCYLRPGSWDDTWIAYGISSYLHGLWYRKYFGNNEHRYQIYQQMSQVTTFERQQRPIVLVSPKEAFYVNQNFHFQPLFPQTCSEEYNNMRALKAHLVVRMLEDRIGQQALAQVFNKMLTLAASFAASKEYEAWSGLLLTTEDFLKGINTVTVKDIQPFFQKWVNSGGHARFKARFGYNRKKNTVELGLEQEVSTKNCIPYAGPFPLSVQELDGATKHIVLVEENTTKYDVVCHSKTRRHKKKRTPIWTGEEMDIDLNDADPDCPVLWIKLDPDLTVIRTITFDQPDYQLLFLVRHERDIVAQLAGIEALDALPTAVTKTVLNAVFENEKQFYRVRLAAAEALVSLTNKLTQSGTPWSSPPPLYPFYKRLFFVRLPNLVTAGVPVTSNIIQRNDFRDLVKYFIQREVPVIMARLRNSKGECPTEIITLLLDMWKYNENRKNFYSDSYYRAALIEAVGETFTESAGTLSMSDDPKIQFEQLSNLTKLSMENVFRALNHEKKLPSHQYVITIACLNVFRKMHRLGILPVEWCVRLYKEYTHPILYRDVRIAAFGHLADHLHTTAKVVPDHGLMDFLLTAAQTDFDSSVRHGVLRHLIEKPPFTIENAKPEDCALSSVDLVERLWNWMNSAEPYDSRIRCDLVDLYYRLYGRKRPAPVPMPMLGMTLNLKDGKATLSDAVKEECQPTSSPAQAKTMEEPFSGEPVPLNHINNGNEVLADGFSGFDESRDGSSFVPSTSRGHKRSSEHEVSTNLAGNAKSPSIKEERADGEEHEPSHHKKKKKHKHKHKHHKKHKSHDRDDERPEVL